MISVDILPASSGAKVSWAQHVLKVDLSLKSTKAFIGPKTPRGKGDSKRIKLPTNAILLLYDRWPDGWVRVRANRVPCAEIVYLEGDNYFGWIAAVKTALSVLPEIQVSPLNSLSNEDLLAELHRRINGKTD